MSSLKDLHSIKESIEALIAQKEFEEFSQNVDQLYESDFPAFNKQFKKMSYLNQAKICATLPSFKKIERDAQLKMALRHIGFKRPRQILTEAIRKGEKVDKALIEKYKADKDIFQEVVNSNYLEFFNPTYDDGWCSNIANILTVDVVSNEMIIASRNYQKKHGYTVRWNEWIEKIPLTPERRETVLFLVEEKVFSSENIKLIKEVYPETRSC